MGVELNKNILRIFSGLNSLKITSVLHQPRTRDHTAHAHISSLVLKLKNVKLGRYTYQRIFLKLKNRKTDLTVGLKYCTTKMTGDYAMTRRLGKFRVF